MVRRDRGGNGCPDPVDDRVLLRGHDPAGFPRRAVDRRDVERLGGGEIDHPGLNPRALQRVRGLEAAGHHEAAADQRDVGSIPHHTRPANREIVFRRGDGRHVRTGETAVHGPFIAAAASTHFAVSGPSAGTRTVIRGMPRMRAISSFIWCVAPSGPTVSPAWEQKIFTFKFVYATFCRMTL